MYSIFKNNPKIDQDEIVLGRQLEISPQGMPLEIYCFANKAELVDYEKNSRQIFLTIFSPRHKNLTLEIMQNWQNYKRSKANFQKNQV